MKRGSGGSMAEAGGPRGVVYPDRHGRRQDPQGQDPALGEAGVGDRRPGDPLRGNQGGERRPLERGGRQPPRGPTSRDGDEDGLGPRRDEGCRDEDGAARLVHRHRVPAARVRRALPGAARPSCARTRPRCPGRRCGRCSTRSTRANRSTSCSPTSSRTRSRPPRSARFTARRWCDGRRVAVKIQYPGIAEALEADLRNAGMIVRLARALAPGLDAKAVAEELRLRVMEELDYEYEAQSQRTFARGYRGHPFIYVPDVLTRLSRRRVLVTEYVEGVGFEEIKEAAPARARPVRRDRLPVQLRLDLPPPALQRRPASRQLPADARRPGRLPRLRDDQAARPRADRARAAGDRCRGAARPRGPSRLAPRPRLRRQALQARRRAADGPRDGGRRLVHGGP